MLLLMYVLYILSATIADFIIILAATWLLVHCIMSELIRNVITAIFLHSRNRPDLIPKQVKNKQISNTLGAALFFLNKMVARKTIVSLVWYLLIVWAVWIIVNFIEKTVSARCPGHFYWKNMLSQEYIDIPWDELNNFYF